MDTLSLYKELQNWVIENIITQREVKPLTWVCTTPSGYQSTKMEGF